MISTIIRTHPKQSLPTGYIPTKKGGNWKKLGSLFVFCFKRPRHFFGNEISQKQKKTSYFSCHNTTTLNSKNGDICKTRFRSRAGNLQNIFQKSWLHKILDAYGPPKKTGVTVLQNTMCDHIKVVHPAELIARFPTTCYGEHDLLPSSLGSTRSHARSFRFAIPAVDPKATANSLQCCALGCALCGPTSNGRVETVKTWFTYDFFVPVSIHSFFT